MSHMPTSSQPGSGGGGGTTGIVVDYEATGSEGTSFSVPIGSTMFDANYRVMYAPQGVAAIPFVDLPTTGRTTTTFPVLLAAPLTAGDLLTFIIFEVSA